MNAAATIYDELPSSGAPHHLPTGVLGSAATLAPFSSRRDEAGSRGEPGEGNVHALSILSETAADISAREALLDRAMGLGRKRKSSEALRRGRRPSEGLAFVAKDTGGRVVGTVRLWDVRVGEGVSALLLGPLAVDP